MPCRPDVLYGWTAATAVVSGGQPPASPRTTCRLRDSHRVTHAVKCQGVPAQRRLTKNNGAARVGERLRSVNGILPHALQKVSILCYLQSLCPDPAAMGADAPTVIQLLASSVSRAVRRMQISYGAVADAGIRRPSLAYSPRSFTSRLPCRASSTHLTRRCNSSLTTPASAMSEPT